MNRAIFSAACAFALTAGAGLAHADTKCSDVNIVVNNEYVDSTGEEHKIKVIDIDYWDDEDNKWRDEVTDNKTIDPGNTAVWNKGLEYVGGESGVQVRIYYQIYDGSWGATRTKTSSAFRCNDHDSVEITVD